MEAAVAGWSPRTRSTSLRRALANGQDPDMIKSFTRLFRRTPRPVVPRVAPPAVTWHAEQDGAVERRAKERWVQMFRLAPPIRRAFLAQATKPGETDPGVLLVLISRDPPDAELLQSIERIAVANLPAELRFETLWLKPGESAPIERVCPAFYFAV
jgi:hypothetical protein